MKRIVAFFLCFSLSVVTFGQFGLTPAQRDSINRRTNADYESMLSQLGIEGSQMRPGPSGNPADANAANNKEDKVPPYTLPNPLQLKNGQIITSQEQWWNQKRPETVADFESEIYGKIPTGVPNVKWQVIYAKDTLLGKYPVKEKLLKGIVDNSNYPSISVEIELLVVTPLNNVEPVPLVMVFGFIHSPWGNSDTPMSLISPGEPSWKEQLISRGLGYAIIVPTSFQADNGSGLTAGIIGLTNKGNHRKPGEWGALRAWAWGASRAIDYLETDKDVDSKRLAIEGLSRYGKATLVAMAFEPRFSLAFIGSSGAGGAKLLKRNFGEQVENLTSSSEYHWFCGNFIKYGSIKDRHDLPIDAHQLLALCAPRPVFVSSGSPQVEGQWVDAKGMFLGAAHAAPVYELLGKKSLETMKFPPMGMPLVDGDIAFRQHAGGHSTGPNWSTWIAWASKYWGDF